MDIDKFKEVNDVYGHAVGDAVLHTFGALLGRQFRGDDIVGRIGGDEFIILMRNVTTKEAVRTKAEQLLAETKSWCLTRWLEGYYDQCGNRAGSGAWKNLSESVPKRRPGII